MKPSPAGNVDFLYRDAALFKQHEGWASKAPELLHTAINILALRRWEKHQVVLESDQGRAFSSASGNTLRLVLTFDREASLDRQLVEELL